MNGKASGNIPGGDVRAEKSAMRRNCLDIRNAVGTEAAGPRDRAICEAFIALPAFKKADIVLLYSAIGGEVSTHLIASEALSQGKRIAYPCCDRETRKMDFRFVSSPEGLKPGAYGIPEPPEEGELFVCGDGMNSVCAVPGLAFDRRGHRLGYGMGYYDRWLPGYTGTSAGLIPYELIADRVPVGRYDVCVRLLVCEKGTVNTSAD